MAQCYVSQACRPNGLASFSLLIVKINFSSFIHLFGKDLSSLQVSFYLLTDKMIIDAYI